MDHRFEFAFKMITQGYYIGDFHKDSKLQRKIENLKRYSPRSSNWSI